MKLYFSPGACSLHPHIVAREAGLDVELVKMDLKTKKLLDGSDYRAINPKGQVPALILDDGSLLTEGAAIVQYLADLRPDSGLVPPAGTMDRYRQIEWLSFISTEIHKQFSPLFNKALPEETRAMNRERLRERFDYVNERLAGREYLMGDRFTAADAYLFTMLRWLPVAKLDLAAWPNLAAFFERVKARPAVQAAMEHEGLVRKAA